MMVGFSGTERDLPVLVRVVFTPAFCLVAGVPRLRTGREYVRQQWNRLARESRRRLIILRWMAHPSRLNNAPSAVQPDATGGSRSVALIVDRKLVSTGRMKCHASRRAHVSVMLRP